MPCFRICRWRTTWPTAWRCGSMPRSAAPRPRAAGAGRPGRACRTRRHPAVRGPAAAGRAGARAGHRSPRLVAGRAALGPGRQCARLSARPDSRLAAAFRRHHAAGHHDQEEALAMADRVAVLRTVVCCRSPRRTCCMSGRRAGPWPSSWGCPRCCPAGSPRRIASTWALPDWPRRRRARAGPGGACAGASRACRGRSAAWRAQSPGGQGRRRALSGRRHALRLRGARGVRAFLAQPAAAGAIAIDPARICLLDD